MNLKGEPSFIGWRLLWGQVPIIVCVIVDQNHKNGDVSMMEEEAIDAWFLTYPRPRTESTTEGTKSLSIYLCELHLYSMLWESPIKSLLLPVCMLQQSYCGWGVKCLHYFRLLYKAIGYFYWGIVRKKITMALLFWFWLLLLFVFSIDVLFTNSTQFVTNVFVQLPFFISLLFVGHFSSKVQLDATRELNYILPTIFFYCYSRCCCCSFMHDFWIEKSWETRWV